MGENSGKLKAGALTLGLVGVLTAFLLCFGGVAGIAVYWQWTTTPAYSLREIKAAVDTHDVALFEKHVDVDTVVSRFVDDVMAHTMRQQQPENGAEALGASLAEGFVQLVKPNLVAMAKEQVLRLVEEGSVDASPGANEFDLKKASNGLATPGQIGDVAYVRQEGKIASVGLTVHNEDLDQDIVLELKLRDMGGYWRLVELSNVPQVLAELDELRTKRLDEANAPIRREIDSIVQVESSHKVSSRSRWSFDRAVLVEATVRNLSDRPIVAVAGTVVFSAAGAQLTSEGVKAEERFSAKSATSIRWKFDVNMFDSEWVNIYEAADDTVRVALEIRRVQFQDGAELKLFESFDELPRPVRVQAAP